MAYDSESDRVILVGGHKVPGDYGAQSETWAFDYNTQTWQNMLPTTKPLRLAHQMAYDEESDLVVLFGGLEGSDLNTIYNHVYTYDYNTNNWTLLPNNLCPEAGIFFIYPVIVSLGILAIIVVRRKKIK